MSNIEQLSVLHEAYQKFCERNAKYHDTWKQYGALSQLVRSANKLDRLMEVWWHGGGMTDSGQIKDLADPEQVEEMLDDAIDLINHVVFFVRLAREGRLTGNAPLRLQRGDVIPSMDDTLPLEYFEDRNHSQLTEGRYAAEQVKHFNGGKDDG